jgi:hypothetical protein
VDQGDYVTHASGNHDIFDGGATRDSNEGKPRYDLMPPSALRRVAMVYARGATIRGAMNWAQGIPVQRCVESAFRHLEQYRAGDTDEDHAAQAVWNLLTAMHFEGSEWDDRYDFAVPPRPDAP